jgi:hypothetical protein
MQYLLSNLRDALQSVPTRASTVALLLAGSLLSARAEGYVELVDADGRTSWYGSIVAAFERLESGGALKIVGRHEVSPGYGGGGDAPSNAPLQITGQQDIVVRGGAGAQIIGMGPGDFLSITDSTNVIIEGLAFVGDRPQAGLIPNGLFSMVRLAGLNRDIDVLRCRFIDFGNHGVSHLWGPKVSENVRISACHFQNGGSTNVPYLEFDGAAVSGIGTNWKILENTVISCVRGFELENSGTNVVQEVLIRGNTLVDVKDLGVMLFATNRDGEKFRRIIIRDNFFRDFRYFPGSATAIRLAGGSQIVVSGNHVENMARQGISFVSADGVIQDLVIEGNSISRVGNNGIGVRRTTHPMHRMVIRGNHITLAGEAGIRVIDVPDLTVTGNVCFNNARYVVAAGIEVHGAGSARPMLTGNRCFDDRETTMTQDYGIYLGPSVSGAMLRDNFCPDTEALVAGIFDEGVLSDSAGNKVIYGLTATGGVSP